MSYKEYIPSATLQQHIDSFWISKNVGGKMETRILPDGYVDIIFDLEKNATTFTNDPIRISGMMTRFRHVESTDNSELLGIRIKPEKFGLISNFPLAEIKNKTIRGTDILPTLNLNLRDQLMDHKLVDNKIKFIDSFLSESIDWTSNYKSEFILSVCKTINNSFQELDLFQVAQKHCISLRQLERRFKASIGVTMKEYHSIIRFCNAVQSISKNPEKSLLHTAFDNGYFDHAHLTKDVFKMAGINPSEI